MTECRCFSTGGARAGDRVGARRDRCTETTRKTRSAHRAATFNKRHTTTRQPCTRPKNLLGPPRLWTGKAHGPRAQAQGPTPTTITEGTAHAPRRSRDMIPPAVDHAEQPVPSSVALIPRTSAKGSTLSTAASRDPLLQPKFVSRAASARFSTTAARCCQCENELGGSRANAALESQTLLLPEAAPKSVDDA